MVHNPVDHDPNPDKGDQEGDRGDEHAPPGPVGDGGTDQETQPGQLQQHQKYDDDHAGKGQQQERSSSGHTLLNHCGGVFPNGEMHGVEIFAESERGHDFALQWRSTLGKALRPAIFRLVRTLQGQVPGPAQRAARILRGDLRCE